MVRYSLFVLEASLTDAGFARWRDVVAAVYRYLAEALAAPAAWVFDEIKAVREMAFRFHQEQEASEYAQALSADMLRYEDDLTVAGGYTLQSWQPQLVQAVCSYLTPHNMCATLLSAEPAHRESERLRDRLRCRIRAVRREVW